MDANNKKIERLFAKLSDKQIDPGEKEAIRSYIHSTFRDQQLDVLMEKHWDSMEAKSIEKNDLYLQQLKSRIWQKISDKGRKDRISIHWSTYISRIAAVLFIPLLIFSGYLFFLIHQDKLLNGRLTMQQVYASPGSRVHFVLPDNSEVWLNSGSTLEYPMNLNHKKQRRVKLNGQGYFKVEHNEKRPFFVEAGELNIKVLGTSFDVSTYANDQFISSTLEKGSIALLNLQGTEVARLNPGQKALLNKQTNKLFIEDVDTRLTTSWKDGNLIFRNTPLNEVTKQLERWFNCNISVSSKLLNSEILYTATIQDETLGEVLKMIEISTSVKTKIENREVQIME